MSIRRYQQFLTRVLLFSFDVMQDHASLYICHGSTSQRDVQTVLEHCGFEVRTQIIWAKNHFTLSNSRNKYKHELIFYCHKQDRVDCWYGDRKQTTVWEFPKPHRNLLHPTMKPIPLIEKALVNSSKTGDKVLDMFGGSGSTLMACENLKRKAYLMEIDPQYVDVTIRRWQQETGRLVRLRHTNETFEEVWRRRQRTKQPPKSRKPCLITETGSCDYSSLSS